ncbi:MAG: SBBP repeat-containing protein [Elusimicrobiota bacterium]
MKNKILLFLLLLAPITYAYALQPVWELPSEWLSLYFSGDTAQDIAVDASENSYIIGTDSNRAYIRKFNSNGLILWTTSYISPSSENSKGYGITVDNAGYVYATGYEIRTDLGQSANIWVAKYDTNANLQWTTGYATTDDDAGCAITVDNAGSLYVTGYISQLVANPWSTGTLWVGKYNTNGLLQWTTVYAGPNKDNGHGIAVDSSGDIYITGVANDGNTMNSGDIITRKYTSTGLLAWTTIYANPMDNRGAIIGQDIAVSTSGHVYATGSMGTFRFDLNGLLQWATTYSGLGIAVDGAENIYISNTSSIKKFDSNGFDQWTTTAPVSTVLLAGQDITVKNNGNVYVPGTYEDSFSKCAIKFKQAPITPTGFTGVVISSGIIEWSWNDNSNHESGYSVYSSADELLVNLSANTTHWLEETGLASNTQYHVCPN